MKDRPRTVLLLADHFVNQILSAHAAD